MTVLAAVPYPIKGEHPAGYQRRLAIANRLDALTQLTGLLGVHVMTAASGEDIWQRLAGLTGLPVSAFDGMRMPPRSWHGEMLVDIDGLRVRANQVFIRNFRYCPTCVSEAAPIAMRWSIHHVTACAAHRTQLRDSCPACEEPMRLNKLGLHYICPKCRHPLGDAKPALAGVAELKLLETLLTAANGSTEHFEGGFHGLTVEDKLTVVERIGVLVRTAQDDRPLTGLQMSPDAYVDQIPATRSVAETRAVVEAAMPILAEWPDGYRRLVRTIVDRAPPVEHRKPYLRRMATEAGRLAVKTLLRSGGSTIDFVDGERLKLMDEVLGYRPGGKTAKPTRIGLEGLDRHATRAHLTTDRYIPAATAREMLGCGERIEELAAFVKAEFVTMHRDAPNNGTYFFPRAAVARTAQLFAAFPPDDSSDGMLPISWWAKRLKRSYLREDLLIDLALGYVRAVRRWPDLPGLRALAISRADFERRASTAHIISLAMQDAFRIPCQLSNLTTAIWGPEAAFDARMLDAATIHGSVRRERRGERAKWTLSVRDAIKFLQDVRQLRIVVATTRCITLTQRPWRDATLDRPFHEAPIEKTSYAANYPLF